MTGRDLDGLLQAVALDDVEPAERLLRAGASTAIDLVGSRDPIELASTAISWCGPWVASWTQTRQPPSRSRRLTAASHELSPFPQNATGSVLFAYAKGSTGRMRRQDCQVPGVTSR
jgi:hypothetical protein